MKVMLLMGRGLAWGLFGLLALAQLFDASVDLLSRNRFLPGLAIAGLKVGGQSFEAAWVLLAPSLFSLEQETITLHRDSLIVRALPSALGFSTDQETALSLASSFGRTGTLLTRLKDKLSLFWGEKDLPVGWAVDEERFQAFVNRELASLVKEERNASVVIVGSTLKIEKAIVGSAVNREELRWRLQEHLGRLKKEPILIPVEEKQPEISDEEALSAQSFIEQELTRPLVLKTGRKSFTLEGSPLWQMIELRTENGVLKASLSETKLRSYLLSLEPQINQNLQEPRLVIEGQRATEFVPPRSQVRLLLNESIRQITQSLEANQHEVQLVVRTKEPTISLASLNDLGINELVASGTSNFKGSPPNRRHNIRVGVSRFNGLLIQPGESFSFVQALGRVDRSTGYLPELVIKGDETVPEFGGGLCQVSTTAFRAILNGGYPVIERKNHSYRVVYYEPAGSDATIYPPKPDLQFLNDSPGSILIHAYIQSEDVFFDFYGTRMPRRVVLDGPYVLKTTGVPAPVYLETSTLPPGVVKQVDVAHRGAETVLYRFIYDESSGRLLRKDTFESHYIPWPAKYLVGKSEAPRLETDLKQTPSEKASEEKN